MNPDVLMVFGILIFAAAIPAVISYFSTSGKTLRPAAVLVLVGSGMMVSALVSSPKGYAVSDLPALFWSVFSNLAGA